MGRSAGYKEQFNLFYSRYFINPSSFSSFAAKRRLFVLLFS